MWRDFSRVGSAISNKEVVVGSKTHITPQFVPLPSCGAGVLGKGWQSGAQRWSRSMGQPRYGRGCCCGHVWEEVRP